MHYGQCKNAEYMEKVGKKVITSQRRNLSVSTQWAQITYSSINKTYTTNEQSRILLFGSFVSFVMTVRAETPGRKEVKPGPD